MNKILSFIFFIIPLLSLAQDQAPPRQPEACISELPYGIPVIQNRRSIFVCRKAYFLQHDNTAKIPIWVAYVLTPQESVGCKKRTNAFRPDYSIAIGERAELSDYKNSGYDMGHIANNADMSWGYDIEIESFILSNMTPQLPGFNRGIWKSLEEQTRAWTYSRHHNILIYAGPIFKYNNRTIGVNKIVVPYGFYKILIDLTTREVLVFRFNHESSTQSLETFLTNINSLQAETGIFFPMPKHAIFSTSIWQAEMKNVSSIKKTVCATQ